MNQQKTYNTVAELVETVTKAMEQDGITSEYIEQLSQTWKALDMYLSESGLAFTKEKALNFLSERYGIPGDKKFAKLRPIDKRRKRAVFILIHCAEDRSIYRQKTYWPCTFHDAFESPFLSFIDERKKQGLALSTINRDISTLNYFSEYLRISGSNNLDAINHAVIQDFMKWLALQKNLPTLKSVTASLRALLKYLHGNEYLSQDYSSSVLTVRCRKTVPSVYSADEIARMLESFNQSSAVGIRNYAMVLMAVRLGMRASDICALEFSNIHWSRNTIEFITEKTGKSAVLPLTADVGNAIIKYLKDVRPSAQSPHIFLRMQAPYVKLNPAAMHSIVTKAFRDSGIIANPGRRHGPHALRASLATEMLEKDVPLAVISETLSHSSTDTTKIYLKVDMSHLRRIALDVPPLEGVWLGGVRI